MAGDNSGSDVVHVADDEALQSSETEMRDVASRFRSDMQKAGGNFATTATGGGTEESKYFMEKERESRDLLAQFMTKTAGGLDSYHSAVMQLRSEHAGLVQLTRGRLQTLLRPHDGAIRNDPAFETPPAGPHLGGN